MSVPATEPSVPQGQQASQSDQPGAGGSLTTRADPTQVSGADAQEQTPRGPDYIREAFQRIRGFTQGGASAPDQAQANGATQPNGHVQTAQAPAVSEPSVQEPARPAPSGSAGTTLPARQQSTQHMPQTQQELDRLVQAETDRRLAKQQADDAARRKAQEAQAEKDREIELRRTQPFEYARHMEQKEQDLAAAQKETERLTGVVKEQLFHYDRNVLDTLVLALPEPERPKVLSPKPGIEGRKETAENTLKALRSSWLAEGRASAKDALMKDQVFIKEILARYGGQSPEPEVNRVQARPSSSDQPRDGSTAMNSWMRDSARSVRTGA